MIRVKGKIIQTTLHLKKKLTTSRMVSLEGSGWRWTLQYSMIQMIVRKTPSVAPFHKKYWLPRRLTVLKAFLEGGDLIQYKKNCRPRGWTVLKPFFEGGDLILYKKNCRPREWTVLKIFFEDEHFIYYKKNTDDLEVGLSWSLSLKLETLFITKKILTTLSMNCLREEMSSTSSLFLVVSGFEL